MTQTKETSLAGKHFPSRYFSIRLGRDEIYTENLPLEGMMRHYAERVRTTVKQLKSILTHGVWSATIEQQWVEKRGGTRRTIYEILNLDTLEIETNVH